VEKELANRKEKIKIYGGVGGKLAQKHYRPMLAGEAKPRGCEKRDREPKGYN
jgi:hypothetical protein